MKLGLRRQPWPPLVNAMLFRIWFYACKVALLGFGLVFQGGGTTYPWSKAVRSIGFTIVVPLCIVGALLGIWGIFGVRSACPRCGKRGLWVRCGRRLGLECDRCGIIVCGNPLWDWKLRVSEVNHQKEITERAVLDWSGFSRSAQLLVFLFAIAGILMASLGTQVIKALGLVWMGLLIVGVAYLVNRAGVSQTNWGTARRDQQPIRFYLDVLLILIIGLALVGGGIVELMR
jgi:hypothetical protein